MVERSDYLAKIRPFIGLDIIKVITGIRRSGKSVFMEQVRQLIAKEIDPAAQFVTLNLELGENRRFLDKDVLHDYVLKKANENPKTKTYVFIDEVSEVFEWEKTVNSLRTHPNIDVYITGSNSKLLSGELTTYLTGRYVEIRVMPFSFKEFCQAMPSLTQEQAFNTYLEWGGMPFLTQLALEERASRGYLNDLYASILMKDIVVRHKVRDVELLSRITNYVMSESGHMVSAASIQRYLKHENRKISFETVMNYLMYGEEAFLFSAVKCEDVLGKRLLDVEAKYYVTDPGMRRAILGGGIVRDIDQILETVVYLELLRRDYQVSVGRVKEKEVDFVCQRGKERLYVQVTYMMATDETRQREFAALEAIPDQYPKLVLSMDRLDFSQNGIVHQYLPTFLATQG